MPVQFTDVRPIARHGKLVPALKNAHHGGCMGWLVREVAHFAQRVLLKKTPARGQG